MKGTEKKPVSRSDVLAVLPSCVAVQSAYRTSHCSHDTVMNDAVHSAIALVRKLDNALEAEGTTQAPVYAGKQPASVSIGSTIAGYAANADFAPLYRGSDGKFYFQTDSGHAPYVGTVSAQPR